MDVVEGRGEVSHECRDGTGRLAGDFVLCMRVKSSDRTILSSPLDESVLESTWTISIETLDPVVVEEVDNQEIGVT